MPQVPPALPPNLNTHSNNFTPQQEQVVNVTPNELTSNLDQTQNQNSTSNGVGNANATSAPVISGQSYNMNTQINSGYGENSQECMTNVGCRDTINLSLEAYYGRADINSSSNGFWDNGAYNKNLGVGFRVQVPLGNGFNGNLDKLAQEEVKKRTAEADLLKLQQYSDGFKLDNEIIQACVNLKNTVGGKSVAINPEEASPVVQRMDALCKGLTVAVEKQEEQVKVIDSRDAEIARLKAQIDRLQRTGQPQRVGN